MKTCHNYTKKNIINSTMLLRLFHFFFLYTINGKSHRSTLNIVRYGLTIKEIANISFNPYLIDKIWNIN